MQFCVNSKKNFLQGAVRLPRSCAELLWLTKDCSQKTSSTTAVMEPGYM